MGDMMGMGLWMLIWGLVGVAVLVAVIYGVVWLARQAVPANRRGDDAEEVLRRRYAAGEIDREEYLRRQAVLRSR